jgi:PAS domain S-box-containing protein
VLSLLEHSTEAFAAFDRDGRCLYVNGQAERLLRRGRAELLGHTVWDCFPGAEGTPFAAELRRAVADDVTVDCRAHCPPLDVWFDARVCPSGGALTVSFRDVTPHVATERALRESWEHVRLITDSVPALISYVDRDLRYQFANAGYLEWFGLAPEQVVGRNVAEVMGAETLEHRRPFIERVLRGERVRFDGPTPHRTLGVRDCDLYYVPDASEGVVRGFYVLVHDMTDSRRAEAALRDSERTLRESRERLRAALEAAEMGTWRLDLRTGVATRDAEMSRMLGLPPQESTEPLPLFFSRVHPDDRPAVEAAARRAVDDRGSYLAEFRVVRPDGTVRWIREQGKVLCETGPAGGPEPVSMTGASVDVSDRKRAEQAVRDANQRIAAVMNASPLAMMAVDLRGNVMLWNPTAERMFGWSADEAIGRFLPLVPPAEAGQALDVLRRTVAGEPVTGLETRRRRKDGSTFDTALWTSRLDGEDGTPFAILGIIADVTERKQAEAALEQARREAEAARAAAEAASRAKDQFLAVLSHELRTPLTPVVMTLAGLELDRSLSQDVRDDLAMIRRNVELETKLIDDLLDVTRITHGKLRLHPQPTNVHALVESVLDILRSEVRGKRIEVACELGAADSVVAGDAARLQQVIWNLVKNAIKFASDGGRVSVRTANTTPRSLALEVRDDGIGIDPAALPRLFKAFEQAEQSVMRQFGGLGLGLAISRALVELHGGSIRAESPGRGRGATFTVELPTVGTIERLVSRIQPISGAGGAPPVGRPPVRVLLVEDHPDTLRTLKRLLEKMGYQVLPAASAAAALNVLASESVDVLVSDIGLPDATGHELMRRVRAAHDVPGIAVSGYGMDSDLKNSRDAGFLTHITKPVDLKQLDAAIRTAVRTAAEH